MKQEDLKPDDIVIYYYKFLREINSVTRLYRDVDVAQTGHIFGCVRDGLFIYVQPGVFK